MAIKIEISFPAPEKRKAKKVWHGEAEAKECLGKCFIYKNEIGRVIKIDKCKGKDYWQVHFRCLTNRKPGIHDDAEGLEDFFAMRASSLYHAVVFKREAQPIPERTLHRARVISKEAGEKIDFIIRSYTRLEI